MPLTSAANFRQSLGFPFLHVSTSRFSHVCARISAELMVVDSERRRARLEDPQYRLFLADLFRMSLTGANPVREDSVSISDRPNPAQEAVFRFSDALRQRAAQLPAEELELEPSGLEW